MTVRVIVDSRETFTMDNGTVYGPWPTRNAVPGGEISTCAVPRPAAADGSSAGDGGAGGTAAVGASGGGGAGAGGVAAAPSGGGGGAGCGG